MKIHQLFQPGKTTVSLEIFPPKPTAPIETIYTTLDSLQDLQADFISVTYGAGGSACGRTLDIAAKIKQDYRTEALAHLTCVGADHCDISAILTECQARDIENILALRGDPPQGEADYTPPPGGFRYAKDLIRHIRAHNGFSIAAAAYPEGHADCRDLAQNIQYLKEKEEQGANFFITQLFFDNAIFYRFLDAVRQAGIACPVVPGIMPVLNAAQISRITSLCGASIPARLEAVMEKYGGNPQDMEQAGIEYACRQIADLAAHHVDGIHLYTMNKAAQAKQIIQGTGLR